jgi:aminoglycoside 6'-N-acetyltransferase
MSATPESTRTLRGERVELRVATPADVDALVRIRECPEVFERWGGADLRVETLDAIDDEDLEFLAIVHERRVVGAIQWAPSDDPQYPHASVDLYLDPAVHQRGLGTDAVRTLCAYLLGPAGFHRLVIDPAADNAAAIRCYEKVGFRRVGVLRAYERGPDGTLHDGLLLDLLAGELR